jgi:uncharacterized membrane-anchored protein
VASTESAALALALVAFALVLVRLVDLVLRNPKKGIKRSPRRKERQVQLEHSAGTGLVSAYLLSADVCAGHPVCP